MKKSYSFLKTTVVLITVLFFAFQMKAQNKKISFKALNNENSGIIMFNENCMGETTKTRPFICFGHQIPTPFNYFGDTAFYSFGGRTILNGNSGGGQPNTKSSFNPFTLFDTNSLNILFPNFKDSLNVYGYNWNDVSMEFDLSSLGDDSYGVNWLMNGSVETRIYKAVSMIGKKSGPDGFSVIIKIQNNVLGSFQFEEGGILKIDYKFPYTIDDDKISFETNYSKLYKGNSSTPNKGNPQDAIFSGLMKDTKNKKLKINIPSLVKVNEFDTLYGEYEPQEIHGVNYDAPSIDLIVSNDCSISFNSYNERDYYSADGKSINFVFYNDVLFNAKIICEFGDDSIQVIDHIDINGNYLVKYNYAELGTYQAKFTIINNYDGACSQIINQTVKVEKPNFYSEIYDNTNVSPFSCIGYSFNHDLNYYGTQNLLFKSKWIFSTGDTIYNTEVSIGGGIYNRSFSTSKTFGNPGNYSGKFIIYDPIDSLTLFKEIPFTFNIYSNPDVDTLLISPIVVGSNSRFNFEVPNANDNYTYDWNFGDMSNINTNYNKVKHSYTSTNVSPYYINVTVKSKNNNYCNITLSDSILVTALDTCQVSADYIKINSNDDNNVCGNNVEFQLFGNYNINRQYKFIFDNGAGQIDTMNYLGYRYREYLTNLNALVSFTIVDDSISTCIDTYQRPIVVGGHGNVDFTYNTVAVNGDTLYVKFNPILNNISNNYSVRWYINYNHYYEKSPIVKLIPKENEMVWIELSVIDSIYKNCEINLYNKYITLPTIGNCLASLTYQIYEKAKSNEVFFENMSISSVQLNQDSLYYLWNFGDGTTSNEKSPSHIYSNGGIYSVTLTMNDGFGCTNTTTSEIVINQEISCLAAFDYEADSTSLEVTFENYSQNVANCMWVFGDGTTSSELNPTHTFPAKGYYNVLLTVYNQDNNCMDYIQKTIEVGNDFVDCQADFMYLNELNSNMVYFTDNSVGNNIVKYFWNFGNGDTSSVKNPVYQYTTAGYYDVCLTSWNADNSCSNMACKSIKVGNDTLVCLPNFEYISKYDSNIVRFNNLSIGNYVETTWDFGDGTTSNEINPIHQYTNAGIYLAKLTIKDVNAKEYSAIKIIHLNSNIGNILGDFIFNFDTENKAAGKVDYKGTTFGDVSKTVWNFGDGDLDSSSVNVEHQYVAKGIYNVCFTVSDHTTGMVYSKCKDVNIIFDNIEDNLCKIESIVYPNPTKDKLTIVFNTKKTQQIEFSIYNMLGEKLNTLYSGNFEAGLHKTTVPVSSYAPGIYFIETKTENNLQIQKLIITK